MEAYKQQLRDLNDPDSATGVYGLYMGLVLANNDPHQMERVRVLIYGIDEQGLDLPQYRWVQTMKHLTGIQIDTAFGADDEITEGLTSYGQTGTHKIGAVVCIQFLGGLISNPIIVGSLPQQDLISSLPGGNQGKNEIAEERGEDIKPTKPNMDIAFGDSDTEIKATRGYEVTARAPGSRAGAPDIEADFRKDGDAITDRDKFGYPASREPTPQGYDNEPHMFSFTSPGQHTILMNDDKDNCRVRVRTVAGNQVILDDTNDRIYISTAHGKSYIEMDVDGHIDVYSAARVSIHSEADINLKSDKQVNIEGIEGINLKSDKDIKVQSGASLNFLAASSVYLSTGADAHFDIGGNASLYTGAGLSIKCGDTLAIKAKADVGIAAGGNIVAKGTKIDLNGGSPASPTTIEQAIGANSSNRVPMHESDDWRNISSTGARSDAAAKAHDDRTPVDVYDSLVEGGLVSQRRRANWRK